MKKAPRAADSPFRGLVYGLSFGLVYGLAFGAVYGFLVNPYFGAVVAVVFAVIAASLGTEIRGWYFTFDRRTLGFARIMLGWFFLTDLFRRGMAWSDLYSNVGVVPNHVSLLRPSMYISFTFLNAFSTPAELRVLFAVMFVTYVCLIIGYKTKLAQILSLIFVTSLNIRIGQIENGGYVAHNLVALWMCLLPQGERFSVDAMLASMKRRREATAKELNDRSDVLTPAQSSPHVSLLGLVLTFQILVIYFFNVIHKDGPPWKDGTAVHYVLYVDRMVNPIVGVTRDYVPNWVVLFLTRSTLIFEAGLPVAILAPVARVWAKRLAIVMMNWLHLGFGVAMVLGPFSWSLCCLSTLLFSREDWDIAAQTMRREHRARVVLFDPRSGGALFVCRLLKRLDAFKLLTFQEAEELPLGIAIQGEGGARVDRAIAVGDIIAALPLGANVAWILRASILQGAWDGVFAALERRDLSRIFGLRPGPSVTLPGPSAVRRRLGQGAAVFRELVILTMFITMPFRLLIDVPKLSKRWHVTAPEPFHTLSLKGRFLQGWFMFSPWPVMDDGTIVVDAITVDGRHIDPFTLKEPLFDISQVKSFGYNQIWSDYFNRMHLPGFSGYRDQMRDYMLRLPERTGNPNDAIVSGDVYWVKDMNPKWNDIHSYQPEKDKLFSFQNPAFQKPASP